MNLESFLAGYDLSRQDLRGGLSSFVPKLDLLRQCLFPVVAAIPLAPATLGAPLGDGLSNALASQEIAAFDALGAPFWFEASHFTVPASGASVATRLQRFLRDLTYQSNRPPRWTLSRGAWSSNQKLLSSWRVVLIPSRLLLSLSLSLSLIHPVL